MGRSGPRIVARLLGLVSLLPLLLAGCGGSGYGLSVTGAPVATSTEGADITVLMIGNSHIRGGDLPQRLRDALQAALPGRAVAVVVAPSRLFLDEHLVEASTLALLDSRRWSAVVLQAQKYSSSGAFSYSTTEAEQLVQRVRGQGAVPVLFPEWARFGVDESRRIWALHSGIAGRSAACAAPVPQAWDEALAIDPGLPLHASDRNHAAPAGALLTALVLQATLTGIAPDLLPNLPGSGDALLQGRLRRAAAAAVTLQPPRQHCPAEPLLR